MNRPVVLVLVLVLAACNPIPPLDPNRFVECTKSYAAGNPGSTSRDAIDDLPGYIDIIKTRSNRVGKTIHATFYLREIPEMMTFNRDGVGNKVLEHTWMYLPGFEPLSALDGVGNEVLEYTWTVSINVDGSIFDPDYPEHELEFMLAAFTVSTVVSQLGRNLARPLENVIEVELYERVFDESLQAYTWLEVEGSNPRVTISREDHTIKLSSEIPGMSHESFLYFRSFDALLGADCISPE